MASARDSARHRGTMMQIDLALLVPPQGVVSAMVNADRDSGADFVALVSQFLRASLAAAGREQTGRATPLLLPSARAAVPPKVFGAHNSDAIADDGEQDPRRDATPDGPTSTSAIPDVLPAPFCSIGPPAGTDARAGCAPNPIELVPSRPLPARLTPAADGTSSARKGHAASEKDVAGNFAWHRGGETSDSKAGPRATPVPEQPGPDIGRGMPIPFTPILIAEREHAGRPYHPPILRPGSWHGTDLVAGRTVVAMMSAQATGAREVAVALHPIELGTVTIRVSHRPTGLHVHIATQQESTLALLRGNLAALHAALDRAGVPDHGRALSLALFKAPRVTDDPNLPSGTWGERARPRGKRWRLTFAAGRRDGLSVPCDRLDVVA